MNRAQKALVLVFALCAVAAPAVCVAQQPQQVTLLHVGDTHSHLEAWGPKDGNLQGTLGGLSKAAAIVAAEKASDPHALFIHAGDLMNGDLFFNEYLGVPEFMLLEQLGLDVFVPGNHEFQFGPDFLAGVLGSKWPTGGGPLVATNIDISGFPMLSVWMQPTVIKDAGGVKVGFFGLTTPFDLLERSACSPPSPCFVVIRTDLAVVASEAVAALRAQGAQVVVGVAHTGLDISREIASAVPGIDVIINGHDHVALAEPEVIDTPGGGTTLIVSAGEYYRWVGRLRLSVDGEHVNLVDYELLGAGAATAPLPQVQAVVDLLKPGVTARYGEVFDVALATADKTIAEYSDLRHDKRDTALGDLFTDAYRARTNTAIAIEATGFLDEGLPPGPIVGADVFRSMSYGIPALDPGAGRYIVTPFRLATFRLAGAELIGALETALAVGGELFPQVSGMRFEFDSSQPPGMRVVTDSVRVGDIRLNPAQSYTITANEGLVMFLPDLGITPHDVKVLDVSAFQAACALVQQRGVLGPVVTGRIRDVVSIPGKSR